MASVRSGSLTGNQQYQWVSGDFSSRPPTYPLQKLVAHSAEKQSSEVADAPGPLLTYWPVNPFCTCGLSPTEATGLGCPVHVTPGSDPDCGGRIEDGSG